MIDVSWIDLELGDKYVTLSAENEEDLKTIRSEIDGYMEYKIRIEVPFQLKSYFVSLNFPSAVRVKYVGDEAIKMRANLNEGDRLASIEEYVLFCQRMGVVKEDDAGKLIELGKKLLCL